MLAIVDANECEVEPTRDWLEQELANISSRAENPFFVLLHDAGEQWNVLAEPDGFVVELYSEERGGALAAFRDHESRDHVPGKRRGFLASLFGGKPAIMGSRLTQSEALAATESWLSGRSDVPGFRWERLYR